MTKSSTALPPPIANKVELNNEIGASIRSRARIQLLNLEAQVDHCCDEGHETDDAASSSYSHDVRSSGGDGEHERDYRRRRQQQRCQFFDKHGFILIESFANDVATDEISNMKLQMMNLVEEQWNPNNENANNSSTEKKKLSVFRTDEKQKDEQGRDDYFLESANKVHFFAETGAIDDDDGGLKAEFADDKMGALNKAGHGMHMIPGAFHDYATSDKVRDLVKELGWIDPVIPQSMYIFKQARIGGEVTSHQDSTFLYTNPRQTCLGLWLALDDATIENGCLWVRPGSHREPVRRKFTRNPVYFGEDAIEMRSNATNGDLSKPKMIFLDESQCGESKKNIPWEGKIPGGASCTGNTRSGDCNSLFDAGFIPIECKAGDLIALPGLLDHLSLPNYSDTPRHTFQLHLVEGKNAGITWSKSNWLQYPRGVPFLSIC